MPLANRLLNPRLEKGGFEVKDIKAASFSPSFENLSSYQAVILENIPAQAMGRHGMENLAAWVHDASGGLVMTARGKFIRARRIFQIPP